MPFWLVSILIALRILLPLVCISQCLGKLIPMVLWVYHKLMGFGWSPLSPCKCWRRNSSCPCSAFSFHPAIASLLHCTWQTNSWPLLCSQDFCSLAFEKGSIQLHQLRQRLSSLPPNCKFSASNTDTLISVSRYCSTNARIGLRL